MAELIEKTLRPLVWVMTPIFFVFVGLQLNLRAIDFSQGAFWIFSSLLFIVAVLGKVVSGFFCQRFCSREVAYRFFNATKG
jgi:Kef-type K+ transport system membrane component KefB